MEDLVPILTSFHGAISRRTFWIGAAVLIVASIVLGLIPYLGTIASLALLYPWTCLAMQRLRDMERPVGLALIPVGLAAISAVLGIVTMVSMFNPMLIGLALMVGGLTVLVGTISMLVAIAFLLWIGLTPGKSDAGQPFLGGLR
ncbi:uncharacterized membrane protein YhaH (DUF805 family) [Sphingomonas naasensis]|uniref:DUF805 domain-containing protein n=1 Tax=Sphingomonas naasensis TaxID=1344951 RepID=A0A4S1WTZ0_9SPHN|nr:hypothetical protein [Sphingomonas naasensis]NIJ18371.1 uncharacterized membrane protein YhaH (DUF805 family) [Sphingomonas naasensis]TGX45640.1 hypothetical protein E5A74_00200 [Sphingomonas naasensis]